MDKNSKVIVTASFIVVLFFQFKTCEQIEDLRTLVDNNKRENFDIIREVTASTYQPRTLSINIKDIEKFGEVNNESVGVFISVMKIQKYLSGSKVTVKIIPKHNIKTNEIALKAKIKSQTYSEDFNLYFNNKNNVFNDSIEQTFITGISTDEIKEISFSELEIKRLLF